MLPRGVRLQDNASALQVREVGKSAFNRSILPTATAYQYPYLYMG